jgi:hypothetical protein
MGLNAYPLNLKMAALKKAQTGGLSKKTDGSVRNTRLPHPVPARPKI